jgi:hypothetical protein
MTDDATDASLAGLVILVADFVLRMRVNAVHTLSLISIAII